MEYSKVLDMAIQRCDGTYDDKWNWFYKIYPFTTENISGYIDYFDLKDKSLLTVGSSCDQVLNAILKGSRDVTVLDINPFVRYYYYLKVAAILELDIDYYLLFLRYINYPKVFKENRYVFNKDIFNNKIAPTLRIIDYESYLFWDDLLQMYSPTIVRDHLFSNDEHKSDAIIESNPYLQSDNLYRQLRGNIKKVKPNFIKGDILSINLDRSYDNIWLSNIFANGYVFEKIKSVCDDFNKYLNNDGMMLISYLYDTTKDTKYLPSWSDIYNLDLIMTILDKYTPSLMTFIGVNGMKFNDKNMKDSALIYKKVR